MNTLTVTHPNGSYPLHIADKFLIKVGPQLAELGHSGRCAVVSNETVGPLHVNPLIKSLKQAGFDPTYIEIPDGEQFKTLATIADLYDKFIDAKLDRRSPVIALGGGVLGDTAGFAAASYLRGVPFIQIPTTLLAMVDASVGGKTGVDLPQGKNLVGAFKQPDMVIIDPHLLATLPEAEFRAGLAEVVKHGLIAAPEIISALEASTAQNRFPYLLLPPPASLTWLLTEAIKVKVEVVQADPFEQGRRAVLNLGHTFAHAFERLANFSMRHGDAVSIGLVCATQLAARLEHCQPSLVTQLVKLLEQLHLPTTLPHYPPDDVWAAMFTDKKRQGNTVRFILPRTIGDVDIFSDLSPTDVLPILHG